MLTKDEGSALNAKTPEFNQFSVGIAMQYGMMAAYKDVGATAVAGLPVFAETLPFDIEVIMAFVVCTASNGSGSLTLKDKAGNSISDSMACVTADVVAVSTRRYGTYKNISRGDNIYVYSNGANDRGLVVVVFKKR